MEKKIHSEIVTVRADDEKGQPVKGMKTYGAYIVSVEDIDDPKHGTHGRILLPWLCEFRFAWRTSYLLLGTRRETTIEIHATS